MLNQYFVKKLTPDELERPGVLAVVSFSDQCDKPTRQGIIPIGLKCLNGYGFEIITHGNQVAQRGETDHCHWSHSDDIMLAATWLTPEQCQTIDSATENAYMRLFQCLRSRGFPYVIRMWNFIPRINDGGGDHEEYKKFCVGRQRAFDQLQLSKLDYPAASALGHHGEGAVMYLLASRKPGKHFENPRQDPAYNYPRQYGPCSPSFARATQRTNGTQCQILISGTAAIVGHDTKAAGDLQQQLDITIENIQTLQNAIQPQANQFRSVRAYIRHPADTDKVQDYLRLYYPAEHTAILHADICRNNLLVEIEAVAHTPLLP